MKKVRIYDAFQELAVKNERIENKANENTDSIEGRNKTTRVRIYFMDDLSERQKVKIKESLKEPGEMVVIFDQYGIMPASYPFLDNIAGILKENPDIRLEINLNLIKDEISGDNIEISEKWAQELAFYFKNKEIDKNTFRSKGFGLSPPVFKQFVSANKSITGVTDFIFMKTNNQ
jgi:outer membrane protein OmpA-like peptidoglycan-associated protein